MVFFIRIPNRKACLQALGFAVVFALALARPAGVSPSAAVAMKTHEAVAGEAEACRKREARALPYPDKANTGVPPGTKLQRYTGTLHIDTDNAVVSNIEVVGDIVIEARNVTIRNSRLISRTPWHALRIMDDATGFTLLDSEVDGSGTTDNAIYGFGNILRSNIHDAENGMTIWGPSTVCDSFVHGLRSEVGPDPHFDGIQINGGHDIAIIHNTVINDKSQTSAVIMGNTFAGLSDIVIDSNSLKGGGYVVYLDGRKGGGAVDDASIRITNNRIEGGVWGSFALYDQKPVLACNTILSAAASPDTSRCDRRQ